MAARTMWLITEEHGGPHDPTPLGVAWTEDGARRFCREKVLEAGGEPDVWHWGVEDDGSRTYEEHGDMAEAVVLRLRRVPVVTEVLA